MGVNVRMPEKKSWITEQEDVILAGADAMLRDLLASDCIRREASVLNEGIYLDLRKEMYEETAAVSQILFQDIACGCRRAGEGPCLKDGGSRCFGTIEGNRRLSILGNQKVRPSACSQACPAGVDIPAVLEHVRNGKILEAQRTLMKYHPMAEAVCLSCGRCRVNCVREQEGEGVSADYIMHWLGADIGKHPEIFFVPPSGDSRKWIAVEGITIAGLTAAYYLRRMGNHVVVFKKSGAEDTLTSSMKAYADHLAYMGVIFEDGSAAGTYDFDRRLSRNFAQPENEKDDLLKQINSGREAAVRINLDLGLKSYLEPMGPFGGVRFDGLEEPPLKWKKPVEDTEETIVRMEAARCMNCGCFGVCDSQTAAALFLLETEIHTNQRVIRAQDYFSGINPWEQLKEGEEIQYLAIPKSSDFTSGCICDDEIALAYAFFERSGKMKDLRMIFSGIAPVPVRLTEAERILRGKEISGLSAENEAERIMNLAASRIIRMKENGEKLLRMKGLLTKALDSYLHNS